MALTPEVVFASGSSTVAALQRVTTSVPIIFASIADPVGQASSAAWHAGYNRISRVRIQHRREMGRTAQEARTTYNARSRPSRLLRNRRVWAWRTSPAAPPGPGRPPGRSSGSSSVRDVTFFAATLDPVELPDDTTERHPVCQIAPSRMRPKLARPQAAGCGKASVFNGDSSGSALEAAGDQHFVARSAARRTASRWKRNDVPPLILQICIIFFSSINFAV